MSFLRTSEKADRSDPLKESLLSFFFLFFSDFLWEMENWRKGLVFSIKMWYNEKQNMTFLFF